jgi:hypothetical protein
VNPHKWPVWAVPALLFLVSALASAFAVALHSLVGR